jgi:chemotaxis receptor (MCP) glutamine deamidase CheD
VQIIVGRADCRIGKTPGQVLVTHDFGSGIGLAIYDPKRAIGGLLHYVLPERELVSPFARHLTGPAPQAPQ